MRSIQASAHHLQILIDQLPPVTGPRHDTAKKNGNSNSMSATKTKSA
jgi:hypothetical protein